MRIKTRGGAGKRWFGVIVAGENALIHGLQTASRIACRHPEGRLSCRMVYGDDILAGGTVRAVICDIYGTLLCAGPPQPDAADRWESGCQQIAGRPMPPEEFDARCAAAVKSQHIARRAGGERFPEVDWLAVIQAAAPGVDREQALRLSSLHASCRRTCAAMAGAVEALTLLRSAGIMTGLASNAQHYTRDELIAAGFSLADFHPQLCFLSGDHGFAKPSPRVFELLTERLDTLGIAPHQALMIGDSVENDIMPAQAAGWRTCLVAAETWTSFAADLAG